MWWWIQATGELLDSPDGEVIATGYSGYGPGKNNPAFERVHDVGPLPCGFYWIGDPIESTPSHGPFVLPLQPDPSNHMWGRAGFLIHGDSLIAPGFGSKGCIVLSPGARHQIADSGDKRLQVVPHRPLLPNQLSQ